MGLFFTAILGLLTGILAMVLENVSEFPYPLGQGFFGGTLIAWAFWAAHSNSEPPEMLRYALWILAACLFVIIGLGSLVEPEPLKKFSLDVGFTGGIVLAILSSKEPPRKKRKRALGSSKYLSRLLAKLKRVPAPVRS